MPRIIIMVDADRVDPSLEDPYDFAVGLVDASGYQATYVAAAAWKKEWRVVRVAETEETTDKVYIIEEMGT